jgi:glycosyltransferase involved in cell wall biosynthesis
MITILTPTYNRCDLLSQIYQSLCQQTSPDFEWVIVDDGSQDGTGDVVDGMLEAANFPLHYFYKENGGKHTALNFGVRKAKGELVLILDSDDQLPPNAVENIEKAYAEVRGDEAFAGVCGYMAHRDGQVIGSPVIDSDINTIDLRYQLGVGGDMAEVFRKDILLKYPFPEIKGERFCPEVLVWNRIAQNYKMRVFSKVIYFRDYLDGGLTSNIVRIRMKSPVASMMTYQEITTYNVPFKVKVRAAINYWRFWCCRQDNSYPVIDSKWLWALPFGVSLHWIDLIKNR